MGRTFRTDEGCQGQEGARAARESSGATSQHRSQSRARASRLPGTGGVCRTPRLPRSRARHGSRCSPPGQSASSGPALGLRPAGDACCSERGRRRRRQGARRLRWPLGAGHRGSLGPHNDQEPPAATRTLLAGSFQEEIGFHAVALIAAGNGGVVAYAHAVCNEW